MHVQQNLTRTSSANHADTTDVRTLTVHLSSAHAQKCTGAPSDRGNASWAPIRTWGHSPGCTLTSTALITYGSGISVLEAHIYLLALERPEPEESCDCSLQAMLARLVQSTACMVMILMQFHFGAHCLTGIFRAVC